MSRTTSLTPFPGRLPAWCIICGMAAVFVAGGAGGTEAGNNVFQGFLHHIARQVTRDKAVFIAAESCTAWFYQQLRKPPAGSAGVHPLAFTEDAPAPDACAGRYPGINEARKAFAQSQSRLSLSLTFYQLALVADRDDNERYDAVELRDMLESLNVPLPGADVLRPLARLNGKFDVVRETAEFTAVTESMQALYYKGYRLTGADRAAMGRVTGAS